MAKSSSQDMKVTSGTYIFKYEGDIDYISLDTLLASQFHFSEALSEIKSDLYPEQELDIKVKALPQGSFQIEILINMGYIQHLLNPDAIEYAANLMGVLGGIAGIIAWLGGSKPQKIIDAGDNVIIVNGDNNQITVNKNVYNIYTNNPKIEKEIIQTIKPIQEDEEITGIKLYDIKDKTPLLNIARDEFPLYTLPNELFSQTRRNRFEPSAELVVYKVVFDKGPKWQIYLHGHKITASIQDSEFLKRLDFERFGKGDVLVADIEIDDEFDESLGIYLAKNYRVIKIKEHRARSLPNKQGDIFGGETKT